MKKRHSLANDFAIGTGGITAQLELKCTAGGNSDRISTPSEGSNYLTACVIMSIAFQHKFQVATRRRKDKRASSCVPRVSIESPVHKGNISGNESRTPKPAKGEDEIEGYRW